MNGLPVILHLEGRRCLVVGGGAVAQRRVRALLEAGARVTVIAPRICAPLKRMGARIVQRAYRSSDLRGAFLVVAATDDPATNQRIARDARRKSILVNRVDEPEGGDLVIPAHARRGPLMLAVYTGGISASASAVIRNQLLAALDPDWLRLLKLAGPWRRKIQNTVTDSRRRRKLLLALTGPQAMGLLKRGGFRAVRRYYQGLLAD